MNDYVIHPLVLYLISVANRLNIVLGITLAISTAFLLAILVFCADDNELLLTNVKKCGIIAAVSSIMFVLIPSEQTCYKMVLASYLTKSNIQCTQEYVTQTIDKAVETILKVNKEIKK